MNLHTCYFNQLLGPDTEQRYDTDQASLIRLRRSLIFLFVASVPS